MALRLTEKEYEELLERQRIAQGEEYVGGRPKATLRRGHDHAAGPEFNPEKPTDDIDRMINQMIADSGKAADREVKKAREQVKRETSISQDLNRHKRAVYTFGFLWFTGLLGPAFLIPVAVVLFLLAVVTAVAEKMPETLGIVFAGLWQAFPCYVAIAIAGLVGYVIWLFATGKAYKKGA